jgi:PAS domain S-box-containing protein
VTSPAPHAPPRNVARRLWVRWAVKLVAVGVLLVLASSVERGLVDRFRQRSEWMNSITDLRANAQAIALDAVETVIDPGDDVVARLDRISGAQHSLEDYLNLDRHEDRAKGFHLAPDAEELVRKLVDEARVFLALPSEARLRDRPEVESLIDDAKRACKAIDRSVQAARAARDDSVDADLQHLYWLYAAVVGGLLLAGAFIHLPMVRQISDDARRLHQATEELRRSVDEARSSQARTQAILDSAVDAVITIDERGVVESLNAAAERLFGYASTEVVGQSVEMLMPEHYAEQHVASLARYLRTGERHVIGVGREVEGRRKDGTVFPLYISVGEARLPEGRRFIGILRDVTARKAAEESLAKQTAELARSNAELEQFASVASHDLQEPLRAIAGFSRLLAQRYRGKIDADADEFIGHVETGVVRMQELIRDLLEFSRVGRRHEPFTRVSSARALDQALENLHATMLEIAPVVERGELPEVQADGVQLTQLFQNLLANALKFRGKERPHVRVGAERSGRDWRFHVADNGIGLDPKFADRIFVIFQRLHTRERYPGTGIGLAICKKIVERHGGTIWVESRPDDGATFKFTLPAERSAP